MWKLITLLSFFIQLTTWAQVSNNSIYKPVLLPLDSAPLASNTKNSTVEWKCINKALTKKCLVYHNDQWFVLTVSTPGKYYLNITGQQCKDKQGLQLFLIEGNPCEVATYKIKKCISKISQDDTFVQLDSLKAGVPYLVNVDGFLGDVCGFEIQLGTDPVGLPYELNGPDTVKIRSQFNRRVVTLRWQISNDAANELQVFKIYRLKKGTVKSFVMNPVPLAKNAQGRSVLEYALRDSLIEDGIFTYRIVAVKKSQDHYLLGTTRISFFENTVKSEEPMWVRIPLDPKFKNKAEIEISIYDSFSARLLEYFYRTIDRSKGATINIDIARLVVQGPYKFIIKMQDQRRRNVVQQFICSVNEQGEVSLQTPYKN